MNLHYLKHFILHYLTAKWIDVLHSPFVFDLYQKCIKKEKNLSAYATIENKRAQLLKDNRALFYEDYGASSHSRKLLVKTLAKKHLKPARVAQVLSRLKNHLAYTNCIELGTSLGITTQYLSLGSNQPSSIHTIEASKEVREIALESFVNNLSITSHLGNFDDALPNILKELNNIDMIFIDGNHTFDATLRYFEWCLPHLHNNSMLVFDDIYWSKDMTKAWEIIKQDKRVSVSIDLFFVGLVFFRKEQVKENFKLRIL